MAFKFNLPLLRIGLYAALAFWSFLVFCLAAARIQYTTHLLKGDTLNAGISFYDPVVVELLFTALVTMPWSGYMIYTVHKRYENRFVSKFFHEIIGLSVLWLFWIVGTGIATSFWGNLGFCQKINACRVLQALVGFSWLSWLTLTALLVISLLFSIANKAFKEPMHGRWDPHQSHFHA